MRPSLAVAAAVLLAGLTAGCATPVAGEPRAAPAPPTPTAVRLPPPAPGVLGKLYVDPQRRFAIAPPAKWLVDTHGVGGSAVLFRDPTPERSVQSELAANLSVFLPDAHLGLAETLAGSRQELEGLNGYASTADEDVTLADGTPAHLLGGTFTDLGSGLQVRDLQLITVAEGRTIVVTAASLRSTWPAHEDEFRAALGSLQVKP